MLKTNKRDLDSQLLTTDTVNRPSYRKLFIFFRSRLCNFIRQNRKMVLIGAIIICILLYFIILKNSQLNMHNNNQHLYVQNPIFFNDIIIERRLTDDNDNNNNNNNNNIKKDIISYSSMRDLIIVTGHAVYSHYSYKECLDPLNWKLLKYQRKENHLSAFLKHIEIGIDLTYNNPSALLIFSGGSTRTEVGPFSEGSAYWKVAQNCAYDKFKNFKYIQNRAFTEDYAMDSFQNILFSICRFYEITGSYPQTVTAISWSYKKTRFEKLHRKALMYPQERFVFLGIDGNVNITDNAWIYEKAAIELFKQDLFGCYLKLKDTRITRNPYFRSLPYPHQCPHLTQLFNICADSQGFDALQLNLPWS